MAWKDPDPSPPSIAAEKMICHSDLNREGVGTVMVRQIKP